MKVQVELLFILFPCQISIHFANLAASQTDLADTRHVDPNIRCRFQQRRCCVFRWMPNTLPLRLIGEQASRKAIHHHRWHLTTLVFLPLQQHLCGIPSSIHIESELLKPELLFRVLPKPLIVPSNIEYGG